MYCPYCGAWNEPTSQYCRECGKVLQKSTQRSVPDITLIIGLVIIIVGLLSTTGISLAQIISNWAGSFGRFMGDWGANFGKFMANWGTKFGEFMANWGQNIGILISESISSLATFAIVIGLIIIGYFLTKQRP